MTFDPRETFGYDERPPEVLRAAWRERRFEPADQSSDARRREFVRLTELRAALFRTLRTPDSIKKWGKS